MRDWIGCGILSLLLLTQPSFAGFDFANWMACQRTLATNESVDIGDVEKKLSEVLAKIIYDRPDAASMGQRLGHVPIPKFLRQALSELLISLYKNYYHGNKHLEWIDGVWLGRVVSPDTMYHLLIKAGQNYISNHPTAKNDVELFLDVINSELSPAFKLLIIDFVLAHDPAPLWPEGKLDTPMAQLEYFETQANRYAGRTTLDLSFPVKEVSRGDITVETAGDVPENIQNRFFPNKTIAHVPVHPLFFQKWLNNDVPIPFLDAPEVDSWDGHLSSSRSVFFDRTISTKFPNPLPSAHWGVPSHGKDDLRVRAKIAIAQARHILEVEKRIGKDERLIILPDVMAILEKKSGNGISVRDLSGILDGHYYMPAFSVWEVGGKITEILGEDFVKYWQVNFAYAFGRAKALLLIRYGIQMTSSHDQNWLLQMKKVVVGGVEVLVPTGNIVLRDMGDTQLVIPFAQVMAKNELKRVQKENRPRTSAFTDDRLRSEYPKYWVHHNDWLNAHQAGINETMQRELGLSGTDWNNARFTGDGYADMPLKPEVAKALKKYHGLE